MNFINKYSYICNRCNSQYSSKEIEDNLLYLCPKCGKAEKLKPLEGVLLIEYDYDNFRNNIKREDFLKIEPGKFWLYPQLWPIDFQKIEIQLLDRLVLQKDNLLSYKINGRDILVFDENQLIDI